MSGHIPNQTQNPSFLTTLQATLDILDDISNRIDENTYLSLANNLQLLHNIHTSSNITTTNTRRSMNIMYSIPLRQVISRFSQIQTMWRNMSDVEHEEYDRDTYRGNLRDNSINNINMRFNRLWRNARSSWYALSIEEQNDYRNNNPAIIYDSPVWRILFYQRSLNTNVIY